MQYLDDNTYCIPEEEPLELIGYDDCFDLESADNPYDQSPELLNNRHVIERNTIKDKVLPYLEEWEADVYVKNIEKFSDIQLRDSDINFPIKVGDQVKNVKWPATIFEVKGRIRGGYYVTTGGFVREKKENSVVTFCPLVSGGGSISQNIPCGKVKEVKIDYDCTFQFLRGLGNASGMFAVVVNPTEREVMIAMLKMESALGKQVSVKKGEVLLLSGKLDISTSSVDMLTDKQFFVTTGYQDIATPATLITDLYNQIDSLSAIVNQLLNHKVATVEQVSAEIPLSIGPIGDDYYDALTSSSIDFVPLLGDYDFSSTSCCIISSDDGRESPFLIDRVVPITKKWLNRKWYKKRYFYKYRLITVGPGTDIVLIRFKQDSVDSSEDAGDVISSQGFRLVSHGSEDSDNLVSSSRSVVGQSISDHNYDDLSSGEDSSSDYDEH